MTELYCIVGFRMDQSNSVLYRKTGSREKLKEHLETSLMLGAKVISIRVLDGEHLRDKGKGK